MVAVPDGLDTSMPSTMYLFSLPDPRTAMPEAFHASEPPTSILLTTTPGMTRAIDHTSVRFGSACCSSLVSTVCFRALVVSSRGVAPVTMMASSMAPIWSRRSARAVASALTVMFGCTTGRKPASSARTV